MSKDIQYTIRNIPQATDQALRKRAASSGKSFNQTVVEALNLQVYGNAKAPNPSKNPYERFFGVGTLDERFDEAIMEQSKIDEKMWQ